MGARSDHEQLGIVTRLLRSGAVPVPVINLMARTVRDPETFLLDLEKRAESEVFDRDAYRDFKVTFTRLQRNSTVVSVTIPQSIRARLKRYATQHKLTESEALRKVLDEALPHEIDKSSTPTS